MDKITIKGDSVLYLIIGCLFAVSPAIDYISFGFFDGFKKELTFPLFSMVFGFSLFICQFKNIKFGVITLLVYMAWISFILISITFSNILMDILAVINGILIISAAGLTKKNKLHPFLLGLIFTFFAISITLQSYKIYQSGLGFESVRSGLNIYGSGFFVNMALIAASILSLDKTIQSKYVIIILTLALVHSILFLNRTGLALLSFLLPLFYFKYKKTSINFNRYVILVFSITFIVLIGYVDQFFSAISNRFGFNAVNGIKDYVPYMIELQMQDGQRLHEWSKALEIISENIFLGVGYGKYIEHGNYSNAHNLILNTYAEAGVFIGSILLFGLLFVPIVLGFKRFSFLIIFLTFILYSNISGVALSQTHLLQTNIIIFLLLILLVSIIREIRVR